MKKRVDIQGITTTSAYKDGDCSRLENLRKKNGVLRPVTPRKISKTLSEVYSYLFQHNLPQTGENLIGERGGKLYLIGETEAEELLIVNQLKSITQLGNILNIIDSIGIQYLWWIDGEYKQINTNFQGEQTDTQLEPVKVDLRVNGFSESGNRKVTHAYSEEEATWHEDNTEIINSRKKLATSLLQKAQYYVAKEGRLSGYCFAITAFELYDGSYIMHSAPVLLGMAYDLKARYEGLTVNSITYDYKTNPALYYPLTSTYQEVESNNTNTFEKQLPEIYAGTSGVIIGHNLLTDKFGSVCGTINLKIDEGTVTKHLVALISSNKLQFRLNKNIDETYKNLIKSVSIFLSPEISLYDLTKDANYAGIFDYNGDSSGYCENYIAERKEISTIIKELKDNQQFYKVHEISFTELQTQTSETWVDIDLKDKIGENLVNQEELPVDNFTHHVLKPAGQFIYNSKLHIWNYEHDLFRPFPLCYMLNNSGIGQFSADTTSDGDYKYKIAVDLKTEKGISTVIRELNTFTQLISGDGINAMISYPDARATRLKIFAYQRVGQFYAIAYQQEFKLTASETHNFAYFINSDLKPIAITGEQISLVHVVIPTWTEANKLLIYRNVLKVSTINNPFVFPPEQTHTIGTGFIRNVATNATRMSEGQFGQYDLYVFTSEGIYSLDTGTEIAYNRQSPASTEIPTNDIICTTPFGIIFTGKRGAYIINGNKVEHISAAVEEQSLLNNISTTSLSFNTFIETLTAILYDYKEHEIIFANNTAAYNWVLNVQSGMFYTSTEKITYQLNNTGSELYVAETTDETTKIKDYSESEKSSTSICLITRPIYFGVDEIKNVQRSILRGIFMNVFYSPYSGKPILTFLASRDGITFKELKYISLNTQNRSYKDFDSGIIARASYRNFAIRLEATMDEKTHIEYIDFEVTDPYNNNKLR